MPIFASLPSVTEFFHFNSDLIKLNDFDEIIHEPYRYPYTIDRELTLLKKIINGVHETYKNQTQPIWVISDHGTTAFARHGLTLKNIKNVNKKHGGRYGQLTQDTILKTDGLQLVKQGDKSFIVSLSYDNLGDTCPQGEAHGGAMPEEVFAFAMKVIPPGMKELVSPISVKPEQTKYSILDAEIKIFIGGTYSEPINEIRIGINKSQCFILPMQYYQKG